MDRFLKDKLYLFKHNLKFSLIHLILIGLIYFSLYDEAFNFKQLGALALPMILLATPAFVLNLVGLFSYIAVYFFVGGQIELSSVHFLYIALGVFVGLVNASWMHNAAHYNFRWRWMSVAIGEVCSYFQLLGYREWQIAHVMYHHRFPDDPERDPHPTGDHSFLSYCFAMKLMIAKSFEFNYFEKWGKSKESQKNWGINGLGMLLTLITRPLLVYFILGPELFLTFFLANYITVHIFYAHFNYFTHATGSKDKTEIFNFDHGIYKILNLVSNGIYYHKTHHLKPNIFNPLKYEKNRSGKKTKSLLPLPGLPHQIPEGAASRDVA